MDDLGVKDIIYRYILLRNIEFGVKFCFSAHLDFITFLYVRNTAETCTLFL